MTKKDEKPTQTTTNYQEYFAPEMEMLDNQYQKNEELYNEVHRSLDKNLAKMEDKGMFGSSSPHRDVAELGKVLNDIRGNQVSTIKERINIKKISKDLEIKERSQKTADAGNENMQVMLKDLIANVQANNAELVRPNYQERTNTTGREELEKLKPEDLGINENDFAMINRFKGAVETTNNKGKK